jgi:Ca2+-transporting ATPase
VVHEEQEPVGRSYAKMETAVSIVKNPRRRFCMVADLAKRSEAEKKRHKIQVYSFSSFLFGC